MILHTYKNKLSGLSGLSGLLALLVLAVLLVSQCDQINPGSQNPAMVNEPTSSTAEISVSVGTVGKLAKQTSIELKKLILTLSAPDQDTIRDTMALSGSNGGTFNVTIGHLAAPRIWRLNAVTFDAKDSTIHSGTTDFNTIPGDTVDVSLQLAAEYSMLHVAFNAIPDSAKKFTVAIDGKIEADSTLAVAGEPNTVALDVDYLSASPIGITHTVSLKTWGTYYGSETILYTFDTSLVTKSGENKTHSITCKWVGPVARRAPQFVTLSSDMTSSVYTGAIYRDTVHATDPDGDALTYTLITKPAAMSITDSIISWTPVSAEAGTHTVIVTVSDGVGGLDTLTWSILVATPPAGNHAPDISTLSSEMRSLVKVDSLYIDTIHAVDSDNDLVTFTFKNTIVGMQLVDSIITWTPVTSDVGTKAISVHAQDPFGARDSIEWSITVQANQVNPGYPELAFSTVVTGAIDPAVEVDQYWFNGTAGDIVTLRFDPTSSSTTVFSRLQIIAPDGTVLKNQSIGSSSLNAIEDVTLPSNGIYIIRVMELQGDETFDYSIALYSNKSTATNGSSIAFSTPVTGALATALSVNSYIFTGTSGDIVTLRLDPTSSSTTVFSRLQIIAPDGTVLKNQSMGSSSLNAIEDVTLPSNGIYIIRVMELQGDETFTYTITIF
jgi:hypothetical protein